MVVLGGAIVLALLHGRVLEGGRVFATAGAAAGRLHLPGASLGQLLLQLIVVIAAARLCGALFRRLGQPAVIGEIVAGILLGPSLLGAVAPGTFQLLFPPESFGTLKLLAEIGVLLFMFVVGLELDVERLRGRAHTAVFVSHASILVPYLLGVLVASALYRSLAPPGVHFVPFALFMGIAMSITAFPVLARVLDERGLTRTELGSAAITCAAVDDVTAWSLLALVVAIARSQGLGGALLTGALSLAFIAFMLFAAGPALRRAFRGRATATPSTGVLAVVVVVLIASALTTERIGIHALFGAFLAGVVMPREAAFRDALVQRLEEVSSILFLPLFFAFTGLRTQVGLLDDASSWLVLLLVVAAATAGKLGGTMAAALATKMDAVDAFALGALMNTRGLMELIALNVGYELGILSPRIFAMMVLMALVTTFATGPLLSLAGVLRRRRDATAGERSPA